MWYSKSYLLFVCCEKCHVEATKGKFLKLIKVMSLLIQEMV